MNHAHALLMCIPATAIAISVLIWLQSIHDRIAGQERLEMQEGHEQRIEMLRHSNTSQEAAPSSEPITIKELRTVGGDGAAMPRVRFDVGGGFSEPGQCN
jgi:hypothetical protein